MSKSTLQTGAILFDVGGVLLTNGWDHAERQAVLGRFQLDASEYEARHEEANDAWERGWITAGEFLARTVFFRPRSFTPAEFLAAMREQSKELPGGAFRILRGLAASKQRTWKLAILNNEARELNDFRIERFGLRDIFGAFFSSCYLGLRKPEPEIFGRALDVLQVAAGQAVFIDDRELNCAAAASLGLHAIQYRGEETLAKDLEALGIALQAS